MNGISFAIKSFLGEYLDLKKDKDNEMETVDSIRKGVEFKELICGFLFLPSLWHHWD